MTDTPSHNILKQAGLKLMRSKVSQSGVYPIEVVVGDEVAYDPTSSTLNQSSGRR